MILTTVLGAFRLANARFSGELKRLPQTFVCDEDLKQPRKGDGTFNAFDAILLVFRRFRHSTRSISVKVP